MKVLVFLLYLICTTIAFSQTLVIGSSKYNPPFETWVNKDNQYYAYGYDIDFMNEICRRLNYVCEFKPYGFDQLFTSLKNREVDAVISAIIVTDNRKELFAFSLPYLESSAQYLTNTKSAINKMTDLVGKKIAARADTPYGKLAGRETQYSTVVSYDSTEDMFIALQNNEVDACIMDYQEAKNWLASNPGIYKFIGKRIPIGDGYAIMLNLDQTKLKEDINRVILEMEADGTFLRIYSQYF